VGLAIEAPQGSGAGVTISERSGLALATLLARKGQGSALRRKVQQIFAVDLPATPRRVAAGQTAFVWSGPDHWLVVSEAEEGQYLEARLRRELAGLASISDQSDGRTIIRISGPKARDILAKSLPLDLHPRVFAPGHAASTVATHVGVQIWQLDDAPTYELAVFRSFAESFWHSLAEAASG
jgi:sarcosine oxidase subunit gamma